MTAIKSDINLINLKSNNAKIRDIAIREHYLALNSDKIASNALGTSSQSKKSLPSLDVLVLPM